MEAEYAERFDRLIEFFEAGAPHLNFDMERGVEIFDSDAPLPHSECGTTACIAGLCWLHHLNSLPKKKRLEEIERARQDNEGVDHDWQIVRDAALAWLGLYKQPVYWYGHQLFSPYKAPTSCTPSQAARALRRAKAGDNTPWAG